MTNLPRTIASAILVQRVAIRFATDVLHAITATSSVFVDSIALVTSAGVEELTSHFVVRPDCAIPKRLFSRDAGAPRGHDTIDKWQVLSCNGETTDPTNRAGLTVRGGMYPSSPNASSGKILIMPSYCCLSRALKSVASWPVAAPAALVPLSLDNASGWPEVWAPLAGRVPVAALEVLALEPLCLPALLSAPALPSR